MTRVAPSTLMLFGALAICGGIVFWSAMDSREPLPSNSNLKTDNVPTETFEAAELAFEPVKLDDYKIFQERPIFHADRIFHKVVPKEQAHVKLKPTKSKPLSSKALLSRMILIGTMVEGTTQKAILKRSANAESEVLSAGDDVNGWTVASIDKAAVYFENGNDQFALEFPN